MSNKTFLQIARSGDLPTLTAKLAHVVGRFSQCTGKMSEGEKLLDEALTFARMGDLDEATHLLRLHEEPKWSSEGQCRVAYAKAMREKHLGVTA